MALESCAVRRCCLSAPGANHPRQVTTIVDRLTPSPDAVRHGQCVVDSLGESHDRGLGAVGGQMIDGAPAEAARRTLAKMEGPT